MNSWQETNWYAVQSKPYGETPAVAHVARLELETFLPRLRLQQMVCGTRRWVTKALFPGYFFTRFSPNRSLNAIRSTPGVVRVVGTRRFPIPLAPEIIASLRERTGADGVVPLAPKSFRCGDRVKIEEGPFAGWLGRVEREPDDQRRVFILLEAIQAARIVVEAQFVEPMAGAA